MILLKMCDEKSIKNAKKCTDELVIDSIYKTLGLLNF